MFSIRSRVFRRKPRVYGPQLTLEQLEERIVLDASVAPTVKDNADAGDAGPLQTDAPSGLPHGVEASGPGGATGATPPSAPQLTTVFDMDINVVLVSSAVGEIEAISEAAGDNARVIVYDGEHDNLSSVAAQLSDLVTATGHKIGSLAIVDHASEGVLQIGSDRIDFFSLSSHQAVFDILSASLTTDAQIQFYGCNVAGDAFGQALVDRVSLITGAQVFASTDTTGGIAKDWDLEFASAGAGAFKGLLSGAALGSVQGELGAVMVKDINLAGDSSPDSIVNVNGTLFFAADDGTNGWELWKSDGTAAGTVMVKDINTAGSSNPYGLTSAYGMLFFMATDGVNGIELWKSDGTAAGTVMLKDINPTGDSNPSGLTFVDGRFLQAPPPAAPVYVNGALFFVADDGTNGYELWRTTGTATGTVMVKDINAAGDSNPSWLTNVNGTLFFTADDGTNGIELWKSNGFDSGTTMVKDINITAGTGSNPSWLTNVNGTLFFAADDGTSGIELWKSTGIATGTVVVKDINVGGSSNPSELMNMQGTLAFVADDGTNGRELWRSNGTDTGTVMVADINPAGSSDPLELTNVNGTLFFTADDGTSGYELWSSDGSNFGTVMVADINPAGDSNPAMLTVMNDTLFFGADDGTNGWELWKSDGSNFGTVMVADINPAGDSYPWFLTPVNGQVFFNATDGTNGYELWRTNALPTATNLTQEHTAYGSRAYDLTNIVVTDGDTGLGPKGFVETITAVLTLDTPPLATLSSNNGAVYDPITGIWTITGTLSQVNTALANVTFTPTNAFIGTATITTHIQDPESGPTDGLITMHILPVVDASHANSFTMSVNEDTVGLVSLWGIKESQLVYKPQSVKITDAPDHGTLFRDADNDNRIDPGEALTVGSLVSWQDAKSYYKVKYLGDANYNGPDGFKYVVVDTMGREGAGWLYEGTATLNVVAVNDAPVNTVPVAQTTVEDQLRVFSTGNGNLIAINDVDAGTNPVQVKLTGTNGTLTLAGTAGLTFLAGDGTADATMTFKGTITAINTALDGLWFTPTLNYNGTGGKVQIVTSDLGFTGAGGAKTDTDVVTVNVTADPDAPVAGNFTPTGNEDTVITLSGWNFTDGDGNTAKFVKIISLPTNGTLFRDADGDNVIDAGEAIAVNQQITWADAKTAPKVKYKGNENFNGTDPFQYVVIDSTGLEGTVAGTANVTVNAVNDAPTNTVPGLQATNEDIPLVFSTANGNKISVNDVDAGTNRIQVQLTATNGTVTLATTFGLTFVVGDGVSDATTTFKGTVDLINAALDGMTFTPTLNYNGTGGKLQMVTNDLGFSGSGGAKTDTEWVNITVNALDDPLTVTVPGPQIVSTNLVAVFNTTNGNRITVVDPDIGTQLVQVQLTATLGTLTLPTRTGLTFTTGDGTADATMTFRGTLASINTALNGLKFNVGATPGAGGISITAMNWTTLETFSPPDVGITVV